MSKFTFKAIVACGLITAAMSCSDRVFNDDNTDVDKVEIGQLSPEMQKVRDYVPENAVIAHRGSTFWTPEETEASYRWAREMGADYLEADLQVSKDGVVLALHDDDLRRTTNIDQVYGISVPKTREQYYINIGYSSAEAKAKYETDKKNFAPYFTNYYTYSELLVLDAGSWFNEDYPAQARRGFASNKQYISSLEDLVMYSKGKKLKRDASGERVWSLVGKTGTTLKGLSGTSDAVKYRFEYETDTEGASGNVPGIYIEFKEPWLNPEGFETMVYEELDRLGMNIVTKPEPSTAQHYANAKVNVGNTNGKVILQTFSLQSLIRVGEYFKGQVPMCFLIWLGNGGTDLSNPSPLGYASFINLALENKAHIIGPSIAGAPNNYPDANKPWQAYLIRKSGMLNHPYSFDTNDQMKKYYGDYNFGNEEDLFKPPYCDAMFTNRSEMTLQFYIDKGVRGSGAPQTVSDPNALLTQLGYAK